MPWKTEKLKYGLEHQKGPDGIIIKVKDPWSYKFEGVKDLQGLLINPPWEQMPKDGKWFNDWLKDKIEP